jgi:hypothetical protein
MKVDAGANFARPLIRATKWRGVPINRRRPASHLIRLSRPDKLRVP